MSRKKEQTLTNNKLYGNYKVLSVQGEHLFNCDYKKSKWYIKKGLAEVIQEEPPVIRLNFQTKGNGNAGDPYFLQERKNICVACGSFNDLTRHHIVPYSYRCHFPEELKNHNSHDILPLCLNCHNTYETKADELKIQLKEKYGIRGDSVYVDRKLKRVCLSACAILKHGSLLPQKRYNKMISIIAEFYKKDNITQQDIENASQIVYREKNDKPSAQLIVECLDNIEEFVKMWRQHFIAHLNPQHLPLYWSIDKKIGK